MILCCFFQGYQQKEKVYIACQGTFLNLYIMYICNIMRAPIAATHRKRNIVHFAVARMKTFTLCRKFGSTSKPSTYRLEYCASAFSHYE